YMNASCLHPTLHSFPTRRSSDLDTFAPRSELVADRTRRGGRVRRRSRSPHRFRLISNSSVRRGRRRRKDGRIQRLRDMTAPQLGDDISARDTASQYGTATLSGSMSKMSFALPLERRVPVLDQNDTATSPLGIAPTDP